MNFHGKMSKNVRSVPFYVLTSEWQQTMVFRGLIMFHFSYDMEQLQIQDFPFGGAPTSDWDTFWQKCM